MAGGVPLCWYGGEGGTIVGKGMRGSVMRKVNGCSMYQMRKWCLKREELLNGEYAH